MATAVADIIEDAYRQENILAIGSDLTTAETVEGLRVLNRIVTNLLGHELGEELTAWPVPPPQRTASRVADYPLQDPKPELSTDDFPYPPINSRLMCSATADATVYFPTEPPDGARMAFVAVGISATVTLDANGRLIDGATSFDVDDTTDSPTEWFYRDDIGQWITLATLVDGDNLPFPTQYDDYFVNELAIRLCPRHGKQPSAPTVEGRDNALRRMKARYRQPTNQIGGGRDIPNSYQSYDAHVDDLLDPLGR